MLCPLPDSYDLMLECWHEDPRDRPSFSVLHSKFGTLLQTESTDAYIELQIDEQKPYYQVKEEETGGRRSSVGSTSSEESIDKEKGKEREKIKKKIANPYMMRSAQENSDTSFNTLGPAEDTPQLHGTPVSQLVPQASQQMPVAASPPDEANSHGVLELHATNYYVEEPSEVITLTAVAETLQRGSIANSLSSLDENARDTTTV